MPKIVSWFGENVLVALILLMTTFGLTLYGGFRVTYGIISDRMDSVARMEEEANFSPFDNRPVDGSAILSSMRRYSMNDYIAVYVKLPSTSFVAVPNGVSRSVKSIDFTTGSVQAGNTAAGVLETQLKDEASPYYILPQRKFKSKLVRDVNGVVIGILFISN